MKQRIKSLLLMEGMEFPPAPAGSQWSFMVRDRLRKLPCSGTVRFKLDPCLDSLEFNEKRVLRRPERSAASAKTILNCLSVSSI
jgi:hypothetical protein